MQVRITSYGRVETAIANLQNQSARVAQWQERISTGLRLNRASDNPSDYSRMLVSKARDQRIDTHLANIAEATAQLNQGVSMLTEANDILVQAQNIARDGANASTGDEAYAALATTVDGLIRRMLEVSNSKFGNRQLFGGTATDTASFVVGSTDANGNPTSILYQGADERAQGSISPDLTVDINYTGEQIFLNNAGNVFQSLMNLRDILRQPGLTQNQRADQLNQNLAQLESARTVVQGTIGEQSSNLENLEALKNRFGEVRLTLRERTAELENADMAEAVIRYQEQMNAFTATLSVSAKLFDVSILDFIR